MENVLILAPHTDDGELGCGGTIAKFIEEGKNVFCAAFSIAEDSVPDGFSKDALKYEFINAMKLLGLPEENLFIYGFRVRHFPQYRQEILEEIIKLRKKISPTLVLIPSPNDIHQDHQVIASEGLRSFKKISEGGFVNKYPPLEPRTDLTKPAVRRGIMTCSRYLREISSFLAISFNSIGPSP